MLDGGAGWGQFRPSLLPDRVDVSLEGSSLLAGDDSSVSATLDFLCGYTWGVTWDLLKYQPRRLREAGVGARGPVLEPESVSGELVGPGGATFALRLKEEELAGSYDIIYKAWRLIRRGDLRKIGVEIRSALENGLKGKVNATSSEPLMVPYLSKAYKEQGVGDRVKFRFDALDRVYFALNPDAHGDPDIPLEDAVHHLRTVEEAIDELELETVGEGRKKAILEGARKRRDKQAPVSVTQVVQAGRDATVQANVGSEGAVQVVGEDPVRVAAIRETLAEIREMLEDDDEQQREAGQEIDAILEGDGASWEDLASRTSAVVKMLAGVGLLTDLLTRLVELLQRTT